MSCMRRTAKTRRGNSGFTLIEVIISITVLSVLMVGIWHGVQLYRDYLKGKAIATGFKPYYQAAIDYTHKYRVPLTTTGTVTGVADPLRPTVAELKALNILGVAYTGSVPEATGTPTFELTMIPAGCSGAACDIGMATNYPGPVMSANYPAYRALNFAAREFGNDAGYSTNATPGTISSMNWSRANPLGSVEGVFGTYITYSASGMAQYLVVSDTRDPNFINNVTVGGSVYVTNTVGSGTGTGPSGTCQLAQLMNSGGAGQIVARASDCVARIFADGATGNIETRSSTGAPQVRIGGDGSVTSYSSSGSTSAGIRYTGTVSTVFADNLQNNTNTGGITASGSVYGTTATFSGLTTMNAGASVTGTVTFVTTQVEGTACGAAGQFARQTDGQLLACIANVWRIQGLTRAAEGSSCTDGIALDSTTPTSTLFCRGGVYVSLNSALGRLAWLDSMTVVNGSVVPAPTCGTGSTPLIMIVPSQFQTPVAGGAVRYSYTGSGPWTVSITGAGGAEAIAWRGCQYSVL
jgi:prepilin-type N-terminal cleavage/methylation domain-containing protein